MSWFDDAWMLDAKFAISMTRSGADSLKLPSTPLTHIVEVPGRRFDARLKDTTTSVATTLIHSARPQRRDHTLATCSVVSRCYVFVAARRPRTRLTHGS